MKKFGGVSFSGKSGEKYYFEAWPLETRFKSLAAVYYVTKRLFQNTTYRRASHEGIYIGQTSSLADAFSTHFRLDCFSKHGANCVCVCVIAGDERRAATEQDLLAAHSTSCN